ncbi:hypothetical protein Nham_0816 [Nitrobacter hamburgensis X14]|uniref:Uncharacterized protein n=1 Tax=Nitrobacter hamburgensis (strain DSM 10229 / NCIMB 13809 / X14) TaxID=323097 RepID=Q1QQ05_NITHX|nr:hypothetical protein Nham_0816 [Nitrobacter hamburgensis X14]
MPRAITTVRDPKSFQLIAMMTCAASKRANAGFPGERPSDLALCAAMLDARCSRLAGADVEDDLGAYGGRFASADDSTDCARRSSGLPYR